MSRREAGPLRLVATLGLAGLIAGLVLVGVYVWAKPRIERNQEERLQAAVRQVLPGTTTTSRLVERDGKLSPLDETDAGGPAPSDAIIAGILNRQGRRTATGLRFTANRVGNVRRHWNIPRFKPSDEPSEGDLVTVGGAAQIIGVAPSTVHRWLNDGFIPGEQLTPGAPWRIRMTEELRARFVEEEREGYLPMIEATKILGVSRQTVLQHVKRGELEAIHLCRGKRKGLRIKMTERQPELFEGPS